MINTVSPASNSVFQVFGRLKNRFDITKLIFQIMCVTVVQWSRSCLHAQINRFRLPATLFSVFFLYFFSLFILCFLTLFFILACFPLFFLLTLLIMHIDQYLFYAQVRSFSLEKGFQELLICILDKAYGHKKT